ncbi:MAG: cyanophycinase [Rhodothermaceae bacterium]|nr:cyanophycinase [Rhodothermaceae bacterium]
MLCRLTLLLLLLVPASVSAQGYLVVMGGGSAVTDAYQWLADHAPNGRIVLLDYTNDVPTSTLAALEATGADVTYLPIPSRSAADNQANADTVRAHDAIFLPGGDQWRYVDQWNGTLIEEAIRDVFVGGGAVGGTSAGAMVLGSVVFDAQRGGLSPVNALQNPFHRDVTLTDDFLALLPNALVDTHVSERARLGRLVPMLARHYADTGDWVTGVGVDDGTALLVEPDGSSEVLGSGVVALLQADATTTATAQPGESLHVEGLRFVQLTAGSTFDLPTFSLTTAPPGTTAFSATPLGEPAFPVHLDGAERSSDWTASGGSLDTFLATLPGGASVGLLTSPGASDATAVANALTQRGQAFTRIDVDDTSANDAGLAASASASDAFLWVGNDLEGAASRYAASTAVGSAVRAELAVGAPALFLGHDAQLLGEGAVLGTDEQSTASYDGSLTTAEGLALAEGLVVMPHAYGSDSDFWENHATGLAWNLAQQQATIGVLLGDDAQLTLEGATLTVKPSEGLPALVLDAQDVTQAGYPSVRNNALLVEGRLHVLAPDTPYELTVASPELEVRALLAGAYDSIVGTMRTDLSAHLPDTDPYLGSTSVPADYFTTDPTGLRIVDWVLLELRSGDPMAAQTVVMQMPALLRDDGRVLDVSGASEPALVGLAAGDYYLVVRHRNHLAVMTTAATSFAPGTTTSYDFTSGMGQAYGTAPMTLASDGAAALWAGDGSGDGQVTAPDFNAYSAATAAGAVGYEASDYTLDGQVTAPDFNLYSAATAAGAQAGVPADTGKR